MLVLVLLCGIGDGRAQWFRKKKKNAKKTETVIQAEPELLKKLQPRIAPLTGSSIPYKAIVREIDSLFALRQYPLAKERIEQIRRSAKKDARAGYFVKALLLESACLSATLESQEYNAAVWKLWTDAFQTANAAERMLMGVEMSDFLRRGCFDEALQSESGMYNDTSADPSVWSPEKLHAKVRNLLSESIETARQFSYGDFLEPMFSNTAAFDLYIEPDAAIALRAIDLLQGMELKTAVSYAAPDALEALSPYAVFMGKYYVVKDDPKNEYRILEYYQYILRTYSVYFDVQRLAYVRNQYGQTPAWLEAAEALYAKTGTDIQSGWVLAELAEHYSTADPAKAIAMIDAYNNAFPDFISRPKLLHIRSLILLPELNISTERELAPGQKQLLMANYKNTDTVYISTYSIDDYKTYLEFSSQYYENKTTALKALLKDMKPANATEMLILPHFADYRSHSAEFALNGLKKGRYLQVFSDKLSNDSTGILQYSEIVVSDKTLVYKDGTMYLIDAGNGRPVKGQPYVLWSKAGRWDKAAQYERESIGLSDALGRIAVPQKGNWSKYYLLETDSSVLYYSGYFSGHRAETIDDDKTTVRILTDRTIYRPGQTVYFKCIAYQTKSFKIKEGLRFKAVLKDQNGEQRGQVSLVSNASGSASGSFVLPEGGFNTGDFQILVNELGWCGFKVEEYKRPKYTVELLKPKAAYSLNDTVEISGIARALAGYPVSDAAIEYTVTRNEQRPMYRYFTADESGMQTLLQGSGKTDQAGGFKIRFHAAADPKRNEKDNPYFVFQVSVKATDLNGEVRNSSYSLTLAYTDRIAGISAEDNILNNQPLQLKYYVMNLEGTALPFTGQIRIKRLLEEPVYRKTRFWGKPDTSLISPEQYQAWFPGYELLEEKKIYSDVYSKNFLADSGNTLQIEARYVRLAGTYFAEIETKTADGKAVKSQIEFKVHEAVSETINVPEALSLFALSNAPLEPGDKAAFRIGSNFKNAIVYVEAYSKRGLIYRQTHTLNGSFADIQLKLDAKDRGNVSVFAWMVNSHRQYQQNLVLKVPYTNKQLVVSLSSFRSNMEPGSREKWTITLKGPASEKAAMEMAAVMYDKALDELYPNSGWNWSLHSDFYRWHSLETGFGSQGANSLKSYPFPGYSVPVFRYPDYTDKNNFIVLFHGNRRFKTLYANMRLDEQDNEGQYEGYVSGRGAGFAVDGVRKNNSNVVRLWDFGDATQGAASTGQTPAKPRSNFKETAFFFPHLYANAKGEIQIEFTMPEALTSWRMQMLAHSRTMQLGYAEQTVSTSKKLMLQPNMPRFLRQGDKIHISSKIISALASSQQVKVSIQLTDEAGGKALKWVNGESSKTIDLPASAVRACSFELQIPERYSGTLSITLKAESDGYNDAEQHTLAVVSDRSFVIRSLPISVVKAGRQKLHFEDLGSNNSPTLQHHGLSVEMCSNPVWYAVQALPYLMEFPNECSEQIFSRLYANSIAAHLARVNPEIKKVYAKWEMQAAGSGMMKSPLTRNPELKYTLTEETPWLSEANSETERMAKLGVLFNAGRMESEQRQAFDKLKHLQHGDGSWPWFKGMQPNVYITQTIVAGMGKMKAMGVDVSAYMPMIENAIDYLDKQALANVRIKQSDSTVYLYPSDLQYLYCKSLFPELGIGRTHKVLQNYLKLAEESWASLSLMNQAQTAMALQVLKPASTIPGLIFKAFELNAKSSPETGMYWLMRSSGAYWHESAIETHCAIMELYRQKTGMEEQIKQQEIWLLRQKQTQAWHTTRSTADACYALLGNTRRLYTHQEVKLTLGDREMVPESKEEGSGYYKVSIPANEVKQSMADVRIDAATDGFAYGAVYWQYFEDNGKIEAAGSGLRLVKTIYKQISTDKGIQKIELKAGDSVRSGDVLEVSLQLYSDRHLDFVYLKDQRASGTEPSAVLSEYVWRGGLGYYQNTRDASTGFFIEHLMKGSYRLNYTIKAEQEGVFSTGIATAQCMYAPEYNAVSSSQILIVR